MDMQTLIDSKDDSLVIEVKTAQIHFVGKTRGPYDKQDGTQFSYQSFLVGDGSITSTYMKDGEEIQSKGVFVEFSKPKILIEKGDFISFKMKLVEYNGKYSYKGSYLNKLVKPKEEYPPTPKPVEPTGFTQGLAPHEAFEKDFPKIYDAVDKMFNDIYDNLEPIQQMEFQSKYKGHMDTIWGKQ